MGRIVKVSGPLIVAEGLADASITDIVLVGERRLRGEILSMTGDRANIQVYEETAGLGPGAAVNTTGSVLSVELGPGLLENIYDGIQRPPEEIRELTGAALTRGVEIPALNRERVWDFNATAQVGGKVAGGDIIGTVRETSAIEHRVMIPHGINGEITAIQSGEYTVLDTIATIKSEDGKTSDITLMQKWGVRKSRPYKRKHLPTIPLQSGQRVIDTLFPIAKGGTAAVIGAFGSGKTVIQRQIAKWSDVDVVVYIGCGERGNEMTDLLTEFTEINDPRTGEPLIKRTVIIANTSDMTVAAREASIYTGITIAEYYRDMGYDVAVIADSTSRWAEALREISGCLDEMPGEEGYPAYLSSRLAQFYERAGAVECQCGGEPTRKGSLTVIGAVSPPSGDISEPVSQATLRFVKVFWSLDANLARKRHFPAISWLNSYSLYLDNLSSWYDKNLGVSFLKNRENAVALLAEENSLNEIAKLVGKDSFSAAELLALETAKLIREDYLQQDAFVDVDSYSSYDRQVKTLAMILEYDTLARGALQRGVSVKDLSAIEAKTRISRAKTVNDYKSEYEKISADMTAQIKALISGGDAE
ncbi:MAG: V-type ATP synthase subunit A [Oscillospiraceae bacterium]|nr:V-type ATP synthase subunit A [Oscillospiraceae bacterium]